MLLHLLCVLPQTSRLMPHRLYPTFLLRSLFRIFPSHPVSLGCVQSVRSGRVVLFYRVLNVVNDELEALKAAVKDVFKHHDAFRIRFSIQEQRQWYLESIP